MISDYKPLPNAVVAEGTGAWNGPGDRGDMAMIAYGAARFALAYGVRRMGKSRKLIAWSLGIGLVLLVVLVLVNQLFPATF